MVVRLHPGQDRKLSEDKDENVEEGEEVDEVIEDGKELEIEIARSEEEEEEVGLAEEAEIENVSDDETDGIEIDGDSQSIVAGIEDVPQEETIEPEGTLEDNEDMAGDGKEEAIESESEEESGEDLTGECFSLILFVCFVVFLGAGKLKRAEGLQTCLLLFVWLL